MCLFVSNFVTTNLIIGIGILVILVYCTVLYCIVFTVQYTIVKLRQGSGKGQARMGKDGQGWARQGSGKDCQGMLTKKPLKA